MKEPDKFQSDWIIKTTLLKVSKLNHFDTDVVEPRKFRIFLSRSIFLIKRSAI